MKIYIISKRWIAALRVTACLLVILACQLPCLMTQPAGIPSIPGAPAGATPQANPAAVIFGPGPFDLLDPAVGLADLSSYQATLMISFDGTQAGQPSQESHTYVMLVSRESAARQITVDAVDGNPALFFKAEANGVSYELLEDGTCIASLLEDGNSLAAEWEPSGFISGLIGAEATGSETVNGVTADRYTFDERALGEAGFTESTGQVWVASDSGVVVRYLLTTTAGVEHFGEGVEGSQTWEYNLTSINQLVTTELPADCPGGLVDAPLMPDAQNVNRQPGVTIYSSAGNILDCLNFYAEQMPTLGWKVLGEPGVGDTMAVADFIQGDLQMTVIATSAGNGIEVRLMMGPLPAPVPTPQ